MPDATTYRAAGVDVDEAGRALRAVTRDIQATHTDRVIGGIGGFGGLFQAAFPGYENPILVSSIDGVGTKTKVAAQVGKFDGLGYDIVHHCVNDILCQGAAPLFFLDYYGTSHLLGLQFEEVIRSIADACRAVGASLIGGETAEMPGVYHDEEIDVIGAIVGVVDAEQRLPRGKTREGDALIGIASDGLHTNGFSLARRALFEVGALSVRDKIEGFELPLGEELLRRHRCYFGTLHPMLQNGAIHAAAHITGGGLYDNLPRVLSSDCSAIIDRRSWEVPPIFKLIQETGSISDVEMFRAFNMGVGMVLVVERGTEPALVEALADAGEHAWVIGHITPGGNDVTIL
ncbi:MAG: phosphoribosylformylglycinamidine cyclo-ligase [Fimbriimonadaceae bacterium]